MESTKKIAVKEKQPPSKDLIIPSQVQEPAQVLEFARKAAKALTDVIQSKAKKVIINGEQYLTLEEWQLIGRFYGVTVGVEWVKPTYNEKGVFGYEARSVAYHTGNIISSAEASCFRDEPNWRTKPSFQLKSMSQTRSAVKALRLVLAWVAVLGGYSPTPAEEINGAGFKDNQSKPYDFKPIVITSDPDYSQNDIDYTERKAEYEDYLNDHADVRITDKQKNLLTKLIAEKVADTEDVNQQILELESMTKQEASSMISGYLN